MVAYERPSNTWRRRLSCQPLEYLLSMGDERVAQLLGPKRTTKPHCCKISSSASGLVYALMCVAFHPGIVALSRSGCALRGPGLLGKVPRSSASAAGPVCGEMRCKIYKPESFFPIPTVESTGGKRQQYFFFVKGTSRRNRPRKGMVERTKRELVLSSSPLLPVIHHDYAPDPSTSIYTENLVLGHPPAIFFLCWSRSYSGEISPAMEKPEQEAVSPGSFHYSSLSSPRAALSNFLPLPSVYTL